MLTKVATHTEPEYVEFNDLDDEERYWEEYCVLCHNKDCKDDCVLHVTGANLCGDCDGRGRVKYATHGIDSAYFIITVCGNCEGIGLT